MIFNGDTHAKYAISVISVKYVISDISSLKEILH